MQISKHPSMWCSWLSKLAISFLCRSSEPARTGDGGDGNALKCDTRTWILMYVCKYVHAHTCKLFACDERVGCCWGREQARGRKRALYAHQLSACYSALLLFFRNKQKLANIKITNAWFHWWIGRNREGGKESAREGRINGLSLNWE